MVLCFQQNILKYLMTEAKEKKQTAFEGGWTISCDEVRTDHIHADQAQKVYCY